MNERTTEILKRFSDSWTQTERRFDDLINSTSRFEFLKPVRQLIANLKQNGEDKYFRLGTSMHTLIISRSVNDGLRADQKYLRIESYSKNRFEVTLRDGEKVYRQYMLNSLDDIKLMKLLNSLKDTLVD